MGGTGGPLAYAGVGAWIGRGSDGTRPVDSFDGALDEVALYNRALTPGEIRRVIDPCAPVAVPVVAPSASACSGGGSSASAWRLCRGAPPVRPGELRREGQADPQGHQKGRAAGGTLPAARMFGSGGALWHVATDLPDAAAGVTLRRAPSAAIPAASSAAVPGSGTTWSTEPCAEDTTSSG